MLDKIVKMLLDGRGHLLNLRDDNAPEATKAPRWVKWLLVVVVVGAIVAFEVFALPGCLWPSV